jgi:bifunctional DNase/RNase
MVPMEVSGVYSSSKSAYPQVVLKQVDGSAYLPIVIGRFEAAAISMAQTARQPARPISYDLAQAVLETVGAGIERVEITELHEGTYYAAVHLRAADGAVSVVDSRPSDAIALALRMGAPIFASQAVLKEAGYVRPEEPEATPAEPGLPAPAASATLEDQSAAPATAGQVEIGGQEVTGGDPVEALQRRLKQAVASEEYEEAARLRDQIRRLAKEGNS